MMCTQYATRLYKFTAYLENYFKGSLVSFEHREVTARYAVFKCKLNCGSTQFVKVKSNQQVLMMNPRGNK